MNQNITQNKNYSSGKAARAALQASDAVLFDLDGTLVDSMWMWKEIDIEYLGRFGLSCPPDLQKIIEGMSFSETAEYFKHRFHIPDSIDAIKAAGYEVGGEEGQILVMSFDTTNAGLTQTLSGEITCDTECNPLHGPRVEEIIQKLEAGEDVDKQAFVDEVAFASDDTVTKVTIDGTDYDITPITQEIIDGRAY